MRQHGDIEQIVEEVRERLAEGEVEQAADLVEQIVEEVRERLAEGEVEQAADLVAGLHPADGADVLEELELDEQRELIAELEQGEAADVLAWLDEDEQAELVATLQPAELGDLLDAMAPDDAADILAELSPERAEATLATMTAGEADELRALLAHEEDSAGGIMIPHAITLPATATAQQAIDFLRSRQPDEDNAYYLFVADEQLRLVGVVSLRQLVVAPPETPLEAIMNPEVISVNVNADQEEAARTLSRYGLMALPTVDDDGRLVGVITADDIIDVIQEEATEDIYRLAGLSDEASVYRSLFVASRQRLTWLFVNLPTALLASFVVSVFEPTIQRAAVLAALMPIVAGMGGNAGIQTLTLIVRSIALGEIELADSWQALRRELLIGVANGLFVGLAVGLIAFLWQGSAWLGLIAGVAMLANLLAAAIAGTLVPLGLKLVGADPALASGVIVTTFTDVTGYGVFLGLATLLIVYLV
jgi:magnesium transporter